MTAAEGTLTQAEKLFESACTARGIAFRRIPTSKVEGKRRPDYRVDIPGCGAFVEVKQIDPNDADRRYETEMETNGLAVFGGTPGERLRKSIRDAAGQLKQGSLRGIATGVAIFDATRSLHYTDPYAVKTAMFGLDAMVIGVPRDPNLSPYFKHMKGGGKATLTEEHNTSISAVIVIRIVPPDVSPYPQLLVYLNHFARVRINEIDLRGYVWAQYALGRSDDGATDWIELE